jgi:hypothetical protein
MEYSIQHCNYEWVRFKVMINEKKDVFEFHYGQLKEIHHYPNNYPSGDIAVILIDNKEIIIPIQHLY